MRGTVDVEKVLTSIKPMVLRGDYRAALGVVKPALRLLPDDFDLQFQYAKLLGDWADELPPARQKKYKREAVRVLKPLMGRLRGRPMLTRFGLPLNFYYQSQDWRGMYAFGQRFARVDKQKSYYARGLGATLMAADLRADSRAQMKAALWARKALRSWERYHFAEEAYYFPHYCYAKALVLAGQSNEALKRLKIAARYAKRPITDWEFADVLVLCSSKANKTPLTSR